MEKNPSVSQNTVLELDFKELDTKPSTLLGGIHFEKSESVVYPPLLANASDNCMKSKQN
jgi:hypothetical protein